MRLVSLRINNLVRIQSNVRFKNINIIPVQHICNDLERFAIILHELLGALENYEQGASTRRIVGDVRICKAHLRVVT